MMQYLRCLASLAAILATLLALIPNTRCEAQGAALDSRDELASWISSEGRARLRAGRIAAASKAASIVRFLAGDEVARPLASAIADEVAGRLKSMDDLESDSLRAGDERMAVRAGEMREGMKAIRRSDEAEAQTGGM